MVVSYISIGNKRTRNYQNKIDKINEENDAIKLNNKEMEGKLKMLKDVKDKNQSEICFKFLLLLEDKEMMKLMKKKLNNVKKQKVN